MLHNIQSGERSALTPEQIARSQAAKQQAINRKMPMDATLGEQLEAEYQQFLLLSWASQCANIDRTVAHLAQLTGNTAGAMGTDAGFKASVEAVVRGHYLERKQAAMMEHLLFDIMKMSAAQGGQR